MVQEHERAAGAWHAEWGPLCRTPDRHRLRRELAAHLLESLDVDTERCAQPRDDATPAPRPSSYDEHWTTDDPPPRRHRATGRRSSSRARSAATPTCGRPQVPSPSLHGSSATTPAAMATPIPGRPVLDRRRRPRRPRPARPPRDRTRAPRRALARRHDRDVARHHAPERVESSSCLHVAQMGPPEMWIDRAEARSRAGHRGDRRRDASSAGSPRSTRRAPDQRAARDVHGIDDEGYAHCCGIIEQMDLRAGLAEHQGADARHRRRQDQPPHPTSTPQVIAGAVPRARLEVVEPGAHLATSSSPRSCDLHPGAPA